MNDMMRGGSMSWSDESDLVSARDSLWAILWVVGAALVFGGLLWALNEHQSTGEAPAYTCAPGETYTVKECP